MPRSSFVNIFDQIDKKRGISDDELNGLRAAVSEWTNRNLAVRFQSNEFGFDRDLSLN